MKGSSMPTDSCWERGYASLLSAAEAIPYACPSPFGPSDRYQLIELAAITTKSWIYRATDRSFTLDGVAPPVAIKISRMAEGSCEAFLGRKVDHEGVVRVLEHGRTVEGFGYVVMDWVDGGDLASGDVPWSTRDAARFMAKLARIVQAAHGVLVIHCDLKPSNVLLTRDREPRLADFDLAQRASDTNCVRKGTLAYMAPEQYRGMEGGHGVKADVYALGGILHFLVTGGAPHGDNPDQIKTRLLDGAVPACSGVDPALAGIIRRALSPDLGFRYETAHALAVDLERWLAHLPLDWQAPGVHRRLMLWTRRRPATAVALAALLVGGTVGVLARAEWLRREKVREAEVATRSDVKAREKYDTLTSGVRGMLAKAGQRLAAERRDQMNNEEVLASLAILQWLDVPEADGAKSSGASLREYGIDTWTEILKRADRRGSVDDSLALPACINLARLTIASGDFPAAARHLRRAEETWGATLKEGDSSKTALRVVRAILSVEGTVAADAGLTAASLQALEVEAKRVGIGESLLRPLRSAQAKLKRELARP
jgi:hypothetical protein